MQATGRGLMKMLLISGHDGDYNMPVFRFAEVFADCGQGLARTNHEDNAVGGAKYYLNQVRKRAGLADETATGNDLIQSILTERLHELPLNLRFGTTFAVLVCIRKHLQNQEN